MVKFAKELSPLIVSDIVDCENMDSVDRQLFFKAYRYDAYGRKYVLVDARVASKIRNNSRIKV